MSYENYIKQPKPMVGFELNQILAKGVKHLLSRNTLIYPLKTNKSIQQTLLKTIMIKLLI